MSLMYCKVITVMYLVTYHISSFEVCDMYMLI